MFALEGHEALATLWGEFEAKFGSWCKARACECYRSSDFDMAHHFGSPRDLCEGIFLRSLDSIEVTLVSASGQTFAVMPTMKGSNSRLFQKATQFESFLISKRPDEAGGENEWLLRMGSRLFKPSAHTNDEWWEWILWCRETGSDKRAEAETKAELFHTLPYFFDRPWFVIPRELPPWTADMIDDDYVRTLATDFGGSSICLTQKAAATWRKSLSISSLHVFLQRLVGSVDFKANPSRSAKGGRPGKTGRVAQAYRDLGLAKQDLSSKEELRLIEADLNETVSPSTLKRAKKRI